MIGKLALTIATAAASFAVFAKLPDSTAPYVMVDDITAEHAGKEVRVHGWVVAGSIATTCLGRSYTLQRNGVKLRVLERGFGAIAPLRDQDELVVTGTIVNGYLEAEHAAQKCPRNYGKYEGPGDGTLFQ